SEAIEETKQKLQTLKDAAEQTNQALADGRTSRKQYNPLQREIIETENTLKKLEEQAKTSSFVDWLNSLDVGTKRSL
ncbi:MAG: hypothetical protein ACI32N_06915, partial [Bulleidia sp.]